jgi:recombination protein RecT
MSNLQTTQNLQVLKQQLNNEQVKAKFNEMLGKKAPGFISSIISAVSSNSMLLNADPNSIISSASIAATLDLPINQSLGLAYLVPFGNKATFQLGYKGFIQLAIRSGQYKTINTTPIYEGQIKSENPLTGEIEFDFSVKGGNIIGYAAYFKLMSGFEKTLYMTIDEIKFHGKKYSKSFSNQNSLWQTDLEAMARKTVLKRLLSQYGILSIEMQRAITLDQAEIKSMPDSETQDVEYTYPDNDDEQQVIIKQSAKEEKTKSAVESVAKNLKEKIQPQVSNENVSLVEISKLEANGERSKENMVKLRDYFEKTKGIKREDVINVANGMLGFNFKDFEDLCKTADDKCINMLDSYF